MDLYMETTICGQKSMWVPAIENLHRSLRIYLTYENGVYPTLGLPFQRVTLTGNFFTKKNPRPLILLWVLLICGDRSSLAINGIIFSAGLGPASSNVGSVACGPNDFLRILCLNLNPQSSTAFYSSLFIIIESNKSWWPVAWLRCERVIVLSKLIRYIAIDILYTKIRCS